MNITVNCVWGDWKDGNCSQPCGGGHQINKRDKLVIEKYGGVCNGDSEIEEECNIHECPGSTLIKRLKIRILYTWETTVK